MKANKMMATLMVSALTIGAGIPAFAADAQVDPIPSTEAVTTTITILPEGENFTLPKGMEAFQTLVKATLGGKDFTFKVLEGDEVNADGEAAAELTLAIAAETIDGEVQVNEDDTLEAIPATALTMAQTIVEE